MVPKLSTIARLEAMIACALSDAGGPADLASLIRVIAADHRVPERALFAWISNHKGLWTPIEFRLFAGRYASIRGKKVRKVGV